MHLKNKYYNTLNYFLLSLSTYYSEYCVKCSYVSIWPKQYYPLEFKNIYAQYSDFYQF